MAGKPFGAKLSAGAMRVVDGVRHRAPQLETLPVVNHLASEIRAVVRVAEAAAYGRWLRRVEPTPEQLRALAKSPATDSPLVSIVIPVYKPDRALLMEAVHSVMGQSHPRWQLCLSNDGSRDPDLLELLDSIAASDDRVRVVHRPKNDGISAATNDAIAAADGEFIAFMDQDDVLAPWALHFVAAALARSPRARLLYSDEDKLDDRGRRIHPQLKPDWDRSLLETNNYVCHLLIVRKSVLESVGGLRSRFDGAQDYDLVLRCSDCLDEDEIVHIPAILYHWRAVAGSTAASADAKPYAHVAGKLALADHFGDRVSTIHDAPQPFRYVPQFRLTTTAPTTSLAVWGGQPTETDGTEAELGTGGDWSPHERLPAPESGEPLSSWVARVVSTARGDTVLFASCGVRLASAPGVDQLVARLANDETVGAVGPRIIDMHDRIDYPDLAIGRLSGETRIGNRRYARNALGHGLRLQLPHSVMALDFSFLLVRRCAVVDLDLQLPVRSNRAVSLAIGRHLRSQRLRSVYEPLVEVVEVTPTTPCSQEAFDADLRALRQSHLGDLDANPYYPRALSRTARDYSLAADAPPHLDWVQI